MRYRGFSRPVLSQTRDVQTKLKEIGWPKHRLFSQQLTSTMADEFGVGCFSPGIRPLVTLTLRTRVVILAQWQREWLLVVSLESSFALSLPPSALHCSIYQVPPHKVHGSSSCISTASIFFSSFLVFCLSFRLHFCLSVSLSLFSFLLLKFSDDFVHDERDYVDFSFCIYS